ncbi:MAG TPA: folylpolyglutamate synthase/dihydrofolate synthase family protein [Ktedonobacteraceae bacterium]
MNYAEALAYIYGLSDFERSGKYRNDRDQHLLREGRLLELLGNPHHSYSCTLVAGTKGKGSTAACVESVLRAAGVRTGLYTQPDLHTFRERIRVRGKLISEQEMADLLPEVRAVAEQIDQEGQFNPFIPYEVATALTLLYFRRQGVQHAVVEVGIGGRLDATNVTQPLVSVIASISFDHMNILGNTLAQIATEKAGIIKQGNIVVTSAQAPEALLAIAQIAWERQARLVRVGSAEVDTAQQEVDAGLLPALSYRYQPVTQSEERQAFHIFTPHGEYRDLELPLVGLHQVENATLALATLEALRSTGRPECAWDEAALRQGLREVRWSARLEIIARKPTTLVDGAHNADSMQKLMQSLRTLYPGRRLFVVMGCNADKDLSGMIKELADIECVVLTRALNPRSAALERMQELFAQHAPGVRVFTANESRAAMELARTMAAPGDLICATGSLYLAAEVLRWAASQGEARVAASIEGVDH